eukprot:m51a1_g7136 hypothetical protein (534) ;mRNA; f:274562-276953
MPCMMRLCSALVLLLSVLAQGDVIVVDQQSGPIRTIGAALRLIPVNSQTRTTILVHPGVYSEQVTITPQMGLVTLSGQDPARPDSVLLRSGQALFIKSPDFIAMNIAIANDACSYDHKRAGQSLAVQVAFIIVRMYGGQDTFLTGGARTRVYMLNGFVNGTVDSIFGSGAAVFDHCEIQISSYYTAHRGDPLVKSSYLFLDSKLTKPRGVKTGSTMLGRPWGPNARVIFKNTWMDNHIARAGWADWGHQCETTGWCHNVTYAEYKPSGPGASPDTRPRWTEQLNDTEAAQYTTDTVAFIIVRMYGGQDTFLTGGARTRVYMLNGFVNGTVDSIFGSGAAVFDHCEIQISSYYTAHRGDPLVKSSYLFLDSKLTKPRGVKTGSTMLGRPWGPNARVIFKNTWMDNHIARAGWADWGHQCETTGWCHNVTYAEYKPSGPGASPDTRPRWTEQLNDTEAAQYTTDTVLRGWNPPRGARSDGDNDSDNADSTTTWKDPEGYENDSAMRTPLTDDNTDRGTTYGVTLSLLAVALVLNS